MLASSYTARSTAVSAVIQLAQPAYPRYAAIDLGGLHPNEEAGGMPFGFLAASQRHQAGRNSTESEITARAEAPC